MMENMQEKLERAYERINELQNKNMELRERNSSLLKEQIQAQAIIEKQKNVVKEWIVVQDNISMTAIKRNSILAVYQNRNMDEAFVCTTNGKEFLIRLPIKTVLKLIIGEDSIDEAAAGQQENTAGKLSDCEAFRELKAVVIEWYEADVGNAKADKYLRRIDAQQRLEQAARCLIEECGEAEVTE